MNGELSYNANDLQTFNPDTGVGIITNLIEHTSIPDKDVELYAIADANGSAIPSINYPSKKIKIAGVIKGSSQADIDNRMDTFKGYFNGKNKNLDIAYAGSTRRYIATVNSMSITRGQKDTSAAFSIEFICTNPFGLDTASTSIINSAAYTSAILNSAPTIAGSAPYQLPVITITINSLTGTGDWIQISNNNNGQDMLIFGFGFQAGDVIVIDCSTRKVTLNGVPIDYNGVFLELEPGANSLTYTDGFTTRNVNIVAVYYKRWL